MKKVVVFGTTEFAEVVYFYLTNDSEYEVVAFTTHKQFITDKELFHLPVIPFENIESQFNSKDFSMFIAIAYSKMNKVRADLCEQAKQKGYELISYVSSKATTWADLSIGENCFIFENNVIQPFVKIGNNVIIWSGNHIGHHSTIHDHCFISSHVVIAGNVTIDPYCFLGINSTIRDGIKIARECLIGAGALILKDTQEKGVYTTDSAKRLSIESDKLKNI